MISRFLYGVSFWCFMGLVNLAYAQQKPVTDFFQTVTTMLESTENTNWRTPDPSNVLVMDLPSGRITIEMRPDFAPAHVARIKTLTREGFFDGLVFHRVIEGFMAQGGDPTGTGRGNSHLPDVDAEFTRPVSALPALPDFFGRDKMSSEIGFIGPISVARDPETLPDFLVEDTSQVWGQHCRGVMSMARAGHDVNSANSQFFLMFQDSRTSLDQSYTIWGRVIHGFSEARRINRGEPPVRPTPIVRMRILSDIPANEKNDIVEVLRTDTDFFQSYLKKARFMTEDGYISNVCQVRVPVRINGKVVL